MKITIFYIIFFSIFCFYLRSDAIDFKKGSQITHYKKKAFRSDHKEFKTHKKSKKKKIKGTKKHEKSFLGFDILQDAPKALGGFVDSILTADPSKLGSGCIGTALCVPFFWHKKSDPIAWYDVLGKSRQQTEESFNFFSALIGACFLMYALY